MSSKKHASLPTTASSAVKKPEKGARKSTAVAIPPRKEVEVPIPSPDKRPPPDAIKIFYPSENLNLATDIEGTVRAVEKELTRVLDEHDVRCDFPIDKMVANSKKLEKKFASCRMDRDTKTSRKLQATVRQAFSPNIAEELGMSEDEFRQEMIKRILIGGTQLNKLSMGTQLSIVEDLAQNGVSLLEYESGCPAKIATTVYKFYNLNKNDFNSLSEQKKMKMSKEYAEAGLRYHHDMKEFLDQKYEILKRSGNGDADDPLKDWPEGRLMEEELAEAFKRNRDMGKRLKAEYQHLLNKEDIVTGPYRDKFRTISLAGKSGARSKEDEAEIDENFENVPLQVVKNFVKVSEYDRNVELNTIDFPMTTTKTKPVEYVHALYPNPTIHHVPESL